MKGRNSQLARSLRILNLLNQSKKPLKIQDIKERLKENNFDVGIRTIYRDMDALVKAGFPILQITDTKQANASRWQLEERAHIAEYIDFTDEEILVLCILSSHKNLLERTFDKQQTFIESAFVKLREKLSTRGIKLLKEYHSMLQLRSTSNHTKPIPNLDMQEDSILQKIYIGCAESHVLKLTYHSQNSKSKSMRLVGPHHIHISKDKIYLIAEDLNDNLVKSFLLQRILDVQVTDSSYAPKDKFSPFSSDNHFGIYRNQTAVEDIHLEFNVSAANYIQESIWHPTQKIIQKSNGNIILQMNIAIDPELISWILSFGDKVTVLSPNSLRLTLNKILKQMLEAS